MQTRFCKHCGQVKPLTREFFIPTDYRHGGPSGLTYSCRKCRNQYQRKYYKVHPEHREKYKVHSLKWRRANKERVNATSRVSAKRISIKLRQEMIQAYGGKCTCCGEHREEFFTLEHLENDGKAHRKRLSGRGGVRLYADLKRQGWPRDKYTLLCMNCNWVKGKRDGDGKCPHEREREVRALLQSVEVA